ncbi:hypothetical protein RFI_15799 [Reticulomyxa filosa]|uniref:Amine oxidase domain-containing protein n=1 Tax=Reticulomyxa filosa TaxID=46433 RepID=X6N5Z1_RETFI|nr:hypothetical protein RFI_15799 [Reticulomyxa filosa]|eukprot:ETO21406.1 hypothetical protein RFI_15799 [Reticulomyxa filosa]
MKQYNFDVGIHYIGNVDKYGEHYLDALTINEKDKVKWVQQGNSEDGYTYDRYVIGQGEDTKVFYARANKRISDVKDAFSDLKDREAVDKYLELAKRANITLGISFGGRWMNAWIGWLLFKIGKWMFSDVWAKSVDQVFSKVFAHNRLLQMNLSAIIGDVGGIRRNVAFSMMTGVNQHYDGGGFYPKGGPNNITCALIPTIEKSGGCCFAGTPVKEVIFDDGRAIGVVIEVNEKEYEIRCREGVISAAGVRNTYTKFAPLEKIAPLVPRWYVDGIHKVLDRCPPSVQHFQIFIGMGKPQSELKLPSYNTWFLGFDSKTDQQRYDYDAMLEQFHQNPTQGPLFAFVGFPSAKDPDFATKHPGKSSCVIVTEIPYDYFKKYEYLACGSRGEEYDSLKKKIGMRLVEELIYKNWPQVRDSVEKIKFGTPLTSKHYLGSPNGESYGLHVNVDRFYDFDIAKCLVPKTPIKGFYLCGQDIFTPGWVGGLKGGVVAAESVLGYHSLPVMVSGRNLIKDLRKMDGKN